MALQIKSIYRRILLFLSLLLLATGFLVTYQSTIVPHSGIPALHLHRGRNQSIAFKKVSIAHYTATYGVRTDSSSKVLNDNLREVCEILDPEEYVQADSIVACLVDLVHFPTLSNPAESYRRKYSSQLWLIHTEESPRNSYRSVRMKNITDLDDWFNLTATLKPESDFHIQYKVNRRSGAINPYACSSFS